MITFIGVKQNDRLPDLAQRGVAICYEAGIPIAKNIKVGYTTADRKHGVCQYNKTTGEFKIKVSKHLVKDEDVLNTVLHELLHTCPGCQNHGKVWSLYADIINKVYGIKITRVSKKEHEALNFTKTRRQYFSKNEYLAHVAQGGTLLVAVGCVGESEPCIFVKKTSKFLTHLEDYTAHDGKKLIIMKY